MLENGSFERSSPKRSFASTFHWKWSLELVAEGDGNVASRCVNVTQPFQPTYLHTATTT